MVVGQARLDSWFGPVRANGRMRPQMENLFPLRYLDFKTVVGLPIATAAGHEYA